MIGIFGGTFDPIHEGHLHLLKAALATSYFDQIRVIPTGQNPHKRERPLASGRDRFEMVRLGLESLKEPRFEADNIEVTRSGPSFSIDTARELHAKYSKPLALITGNEVFASLPRWKEPQALLELASCLVVRRDHDLPIDIERVLQILGFHQLSKRIGQPHRIYYHPERWTETIPLKPLPVSATALRKALAASPKTRPPALPLSVWDYIKKNRLYSVK